MNTTESVWSRGFFGWCAMAAAALAASPSGSFAQEAQPDSSVARASRLEELERSTRDQLDEVYAEAEQIVRDLEAQIAERTMDYMMQVQRDQRELERSRRLLRRLSERTGRPAPEATLTVQPAPFFVLQGAVQPSTVQGPQAATPSPFQPAVPSQFHGVVPTLFQAAAPSPEASTPEDDSDESLLMQQLLQRLRDLEDSMAPPAPVIPDFGYPQAPQAALTTIRIGLSPSTTVRFLPPSPTSAFGSLELSAERLQFEVGPPGGGMMEPIPAEDEEVETPIIPSASDGPPRY